MSTQQPPNAPQQWAAPQGQPPQPGQPPQQAAQAYPQGAQQPQAYPQGGPYGAAQQHPGQPSAQYPGQYQGGQPPQYSDPRPASGGNLGLIALIVAGALLLVLMITNMVLTYTGTYGAQPIVWWARVILMAGACVLAVLAIIRKQRPVLGGIALGIAAATFLEQFLWLVVGAVATNIPY